MFNDVAAKTDMSIADGLQNKLGVKVNGVPQFIDLAATNINRGRDHGIPSYVKYREYCGLPPITNFDGLNNTIKAGDTTTINQLKSVYEYISLCLNFVSFSKI